jgi:rifampin ADP-ribosylating transferase
LHAVCMTTEPKPFEGYEAGTLLHGTKADLAVGQLLVPGHPSNFEEGRIMNHVYVTATLDAATWGLNWLLEKAEDRSAWWSRRAPSRTTRT